MRLITMPFLMLRAAKEDARRARSQWRYGLTVAIFAGVVGGVLLVGMM